MAVVKNFQRIADNGYDAVTIDTWALSERNNIIGFTAHGIHYHLKAHEEPRHFFADAMALVGGAGMAGGGTGLVIGGMKGPKAMLKGAAIGSFLFFAAELAYKEIMEHLKTNPNVKLCYVDDNGSEVYWGPVAAS